MRNITFIDAIREALIEEMETDTSVLLMGQDIGPYGGIRGVTRGLVERFGKERVRDTPLTETAIIGGGMGAALAGMKPVCELMMMGFTAVCFDEIQNLAGKWPFIHGDPRFKVPMVIRGSFGAGNGGIEPHAQSPEAFFMHCPGLIVVVPSTPHDAKGLMKTAEAARSLAGKGIELEVIDPRTLVPLDEETILNSVKKTGRLLIVHEAYKRAGSGAEIAAMVAEKGFQYLKAPVIRLGAPNHPIPFSPSLKEHYFPNAERIESAATALSEA